MIRKHLAALVCVWLLNGAAVDGSSMNGDRPTSLSFPRDFGQHPNFRQEWWSASGSLETKAGRQFRWQTSFFRFTLGRGETLYSSEFSVLDVRSGKKETQQRSARELIANTAGSSNSISVDRWHLTTHAVPNPMQSTIDVAVGSASTGFTLQLLPQKRPVRSLAFAGYAFTRLKATGQLHFEGSDYRLRGSAWLDHEYETMAVATQHIGWERFELQLDDGRELQLYSSRLRDDRFHLPSQRRGAPELAAQQTLVGSREPMEGVLVDRSGRPHHLSPDRIQLIVRAGTRWHSPHTDATYPALWQLGLDEEAIIAIAPTARDQERTPEPTGVALWYGAVDLVQADPPGLALGNGFVELSGYATPTPL